MKKQHRNALRLDVTTIRRLQYARLDAIAGGRAPLPETQQFGCSKDCFPTTLDSSVCESNVC